MPTIRKRFLVALVLAAGATGYVVAGQPDIAGMVGALGSGIEQLGDAAGSGGPGSDGSVADGPGGPVAGASGIPGSIPEGATEATIEYVHDGDTLFLADGRKVRLLGINTPEIGDNLECYGDESTALLRQLLPEGTHVWVMQDVEPLDQYGRSLLFVYRDDAVNVNLELLVQGAAEVEMYAPNLLLQESIEQAEQSARAAGAGMWGSC